MTVSPRELLFDESGEGLRVLTLYGPGLAPRRQPEALPHAEAAHGPIPPGPPTPPGTASGGGPDTLTAGGCPWDLRHILPYNRGRRLGAI